MNELQDDGIPLREHLMSLWRQTREKPEMLQEAMDCPDLAVHVWSYFCIMRSQTSKDQRISARTMQEHEWCYAVELELWERKAILLIDSLYMKRSSKSG